MDRVLNPYEPGAGRRPPELVGRGEVIEDIAVAMARCEQGRGARGHVLHGLRGVGKTVLLNQFRADAAQRGWIVAKVEGSTARTSASQHIVEGLYTSLRNVTGRAPDPLPERLKRALGVFKAFTVKVDPDGAYALGVDVAAATGRADSGDLPTDLTELLVELGHAAADLGVGVLLLIDEMQDLDRHAVVAVNLAAHEIGQSATALPVLVVGAGLPSLPAMLADATSYAERLYQYHSVRALDDGAARDALVLPARQLGVQWAPEALDETLSASGGYPFALQSCGKAVWDLAPRSPITADDAIVGIEAARREMDDGINLSRWKRATPGQRHFLHALATHGEEAAVAMSEITSALGRKPKDLSAQRDQLIKKGLVFAPERGLIAFTAPGMAEYVRRQP